jgi:epoxyqueuosine reductase
MTPDNLLVQLKAQSNALGFSQLGITHTGVGELSQAHQAWLAQQYHGEMSYLARNNDLRARPERLHPGTISIISLTLPYLDGQALAPQTQLEHSEKAYLSRYALGRDYHKVFRRKLERLAQWLAEAAQPTLDYRVFVDSAPIFERHFAEQAGLGWTGKNTLLLNQQHGSFFFLGEIFTNLPLEVFGQPQVAPDFKGCGSCSRCLDFCPTQAFVAPGVLDARKCISYLTIEHKGVIPLELREKMGNRIYGCDDCQLVCPWNKYAQLTEEADFKTRHALDRAGLLELFNWTEREFLEKTAGMAIRRIGHTQWRRNLAVALGNSAYSENKIMALQTARHEADGLLAEHIDWAIAQLLAKKDAQADPLDTQVESAPEPLRVFLPKVLK